MKEEIDNPTIIVGDFKVPLSIMDRTSRWRISKETEDLDGTTNQLHLTDIRGTLHPTAAECTFFVRAHQVLSVRGHILGQEISLNKFKRTEVMQSKFSDYSRMKLEINN